MKAEALFELDLPIEVAAGQIGKITVDIPWTSLRTEPVLVHLEDILIVAQPISEHEFDEALERRLNRARKSKVLDDAKRNKRSKNGPNSKPFGDQGPDLSKNRTFFETMVATIVNNVQISVQNVHFRFEDTITRPDGNGIACGLAFKSLTAITTNSRWKTKQVDIDSSNIFKVVAQRLKERSKVIAFRSHTSHVTVSVF